VRPCLSAGARANMQLDLSPLLTVKFEGLQKPKVLVLSPSSLLLTLAIRVVVWIAKQVQERARARGVDLRHRSIIIAKFLAQRCLLLLRLNACYKFL
jgi:hypothetical protein